MSRAVWPALPEPPVAWGGALQLCSRKRDAKWWGVARRADALAAWQTEAGGDTATVVADLGDRSAHHAIAEHVRAPFGAPDILINAAGINTREHADDVTAARVGHDPRPLTCRRRSSLAQALVPAMKAKGWGRIVNFASLQITARLCQRDQLRSRQRGRGSNDTGHGRGVVCRTGSRANAVGPGILSRPN